MDTANGGALARAASFYENYGGRARSLAKEGRRSMGYISVVPLEILAAAGFIPVRIKGDPAKAVTKADSMMETLVCPFLRSAFDLTLKGSYDYLEGVVIPHTCDSVSRTYDVWKHNVPLPYYHFLNVPHVDGAPSLEFFVDVLRTFVKSLERHAGKPISKEGLADAVRAYNANRKAMRDVYELRKADVPPVSGVEMMKLLAAVKALPVEEATALAQNVAGEAKARKTPSGPKPRRLMIVGDQIDDTMLAQAVENTGARVVTDDISIGSKLYYADVEETAEPLEGIAEYYLRKVSLPTFYRDAGGSYAENLELRFGHLKRLISEFKVDGVILMVYKNCDPYGFEVPAATAYIESTGTPVFYVEDDYSSASAGRLRTRVEAFLETIA